MPPPITTTTTETPEKSTITSWITSLMTAAFASSVAEGITYPLDVAKVRWMRNSGRKTVLQMLGSFRAEPIRSIYAGLGPAMLRQIIYGGIGTGSYTHLRSYLLSPGETSLDCPLWKRILAGSLTGGLGQAVASPIDVIKVRLQVDGELVRLQGHHTRRYQHGRNAFMTIARSEGVKGFYSGIGPSVIRAAVINGCGIASYDHSKQSILQFTGWGKGDQLVHILAAASSGLVSAIVANPIDVIKVRLMNDSARHYQGRIVDCVLSTIRKEGPLAFYKGFVPSYARLAPWQLVFFTTFEALNSFFLGETL